MIASLTLMWIMWKERNVRIFEDTCMTFEMMWDLIHFFVSFLA